MRNFISALFILAGALGLMVTLYSPSQGETAVNASQAKPTISLTATR